MRLAKTFTMFWSFALRSAPVRCLSLRVLLTCFLPVVIAGCATPRNLVGIGEPLSNESGSISGATHRIYVATTRAPSDDEGVFFSGDRSESPHFASVDVSIPPNHQPGEVSLPRNGPPDPLKHIVLHNPQRITGAASFADVIDGAAATRNVTRRSALVFVHGYNTNMTEAVARFAQLVEDTGYQGIPILFSWPSTRRTIDYVADINSAAISRDDMGQVALLLETTRVNGFDIVAHSMGNFLTMEAVRTMSLQGNLEALNKLNTIVLASPDIDVDLFVRQLATVPSEERRKFVILMSRDDKALRVARMVAGNQPRLGAADAQSISQLGLTVIDLTEIEDTASINHSKFADSPEIVQLLGQRLAKGDALSTEENAGGVFIQKVGGVIDVFQVP